MDRTREGARAHARLIRNMYKSVLDDIFSKSGIIRMFLSQVTANFRPRLHYPFSTDMNVEPTYFDNVYKLLLGES